MSVFLPPPQRIAPSPQQDQLKFGVHLQIEAVPFLRNGLVLIHANITIPETVTDLRDFTVLLDIPALMC